MTDNTSSPGVGQTFVGFDNFATTCEREIATLKALNKVDAPHANSISNGTATCCFLSGSDQTTGSNANSSSANREDDGKATCDCSKVSVVFSRTGCDQDKYFAERLQIPALGTSIPDIIGDYVLAAEQGLLDPYNHDLLLSEARPGEYTLGSLDYAKISPAMLSGTDVYSSILRRLEQLVMPDLFAEARNHYCNLLNIDDLSDTADSSSDLLLYAPRWSPACSSLILKRDGSR